MDSELTETLQTLKFPEVFTEKLTELGVTSGSDVLELQNDDLKGIGMNLVQIRRLQNALKGETPAAAPAPVAAAALVCPSGNPLEKAIAQNDQYSCDSCGKKIPKGCPVLSSRISNYDVCMVCAKKGQSNGNGAAKNGFGGGGMPGCKWCEKGECWTHAGGKGGGGGKGGLPQVVKRVHSTKPFKRKFLEYAEGDFDPVSANMARDSLELVIDGGPDANDSYCPPVNSFQEIEGLPAHCIEALDQMGIQVPMPIQAQAIPLVLGGDDFVGVAKTGSGKTLAYLLPAIVHIEDQEPIQDTDLSPIVVILAPTRELAVQINEEATKLIACSEGAEGSNHPDGLKTCCIYGGMKKDGQLRQACGAHILAATPGRLHEHVLKDDISMERVTYFVLDEGDRMLEEGFESQVKVISNAIRPDRHMLFFSATWPQNVHRLAKAMCKGKKPPVRLRVGQNSDGTAKTRDDIVQEVVVFDEGDWETRDKAKKALVYEHVRNALSMEETKVLVFVSRKDLADEVSYAFNGEGFESESMHGGKSQDARLQVLERFKNANTRLLVTTDVMGRGLDIPTITHVVVYDMGDIEDYVHRIGRTARGPHGAGHALTLFEYDQRWPHLAEGLISVMEKSNQSIPDELREIAQEVSEGKRSTKVMKGRYGKMSGNHGSFAQIQKKVYGVEADGNALARW